MLREVSEVSLDAWHKARYLEVVYSKFLGVHECGKVRQDTPAKLFGSEMVKTTLPRADP
jgi:hypothetical protein